MEIPQHLSLLSILPLFVTSRFTVTFKASCRNFSMSHMLFYFGFELRDFHVKHKEMPGINLILIFWCEISMQALFIPYMCMPAFLSSPPKHWTPHHSISFQRSRFSILLFGNSVLEFITLDAATPFLSSCAIRVSKWCDLPATQYNLRTEAINSIDPSKSLQHVQSFYNAKVDRKS